MKLRKIQIKDFRGLKEFEWDFTDIQGYVAPLTMIVGPNNSGKSAILDAIWFGLMGIVGYQVQRIGFNPEKFYVVRRGANYAKVDYELEITAAEHQQIAVWKDELVARGEMGDYKFPSQHTAAISWTYPAQAHYNANHYQYGGYSKKGMDWALLKGHSYYRNLEKINATSPSGRELRGGIYLFEQERQMSAEDSQFSENDKSANPSKTLEGSLIRLAQLSDYGNDQRYQKLQESFNEVCYPHKLGKIVVPNERLTIEFYDEKDNTYTFDSLSSGQRSVLYFLTRYLSMQMVNAIVLIDELEVHLHPTWQRRLFHSLTQLEDNNQFIITTHSPTLEMLAHQENIISLGELDVPDWQLNMDYNEEYD